MLQLQEAHVGPEVLPDGVVFSTLLADRIWSETNVRVTCRSRQQLGDGKN